MSARPDRDTAPRLSRRGVLLGALALSSVAALPVATGCTPSDPRVDSAGRSVTQKSTPDPSATPLVPPPAETLQAERDLAALATAILVGPHRAELSKVQRPLLTALAAAHEQHVVALTSPEPTTRPIAPSPAGTPTTSPPAGVNQLSLAQSMARLGKMESGQATLLRRTALRSLGFEALLSGSMGVAATTYAAALTSATVVPAAMEPKPHLPMAAVSDVEAIQSMVRQLHAIVYGYQLALGHLKASSPDGQQALASLRQHRMLRDRLVQLLVARSANVPAASAAYVPSTDPTTAGRSAKLIRQMETALQPFCGLWLASAVKLEDRALALDTLVRTTQTARRWKAPLTVWPGWQD